MADTTLRRATGVLAATIYDDCNGSHGPGLEAVWIWPDTPEPPEMTFSHMPDGSLRHWFDGDLASLTYDCDDTCPYASDDDCEGQDEREETPGGGQ